MTKRKRRALALAEAGSAEVGGTSNGRETEEAQPQDRSPFVLQGQKITFDLTIREFPWTEKQKIFIEAGLDKGTNYIMCEAPPGVGKTLVSIYIGLRLLAQKRISNIYFVRLPIESASKGLGFLPGLAQDKMSVYEGPLYDQLNSLLPPSQVAKLIKDGFIQSVPLGYVKGRTFNSALILVDEAEDLSTREMLLIMGRLGKFAKMFLIGDPDQSNVRDSGFKATLDEFNDPESMEKGIYCFSFDESDIKRSGILSYVIKKFRGLSRYS